MRKRTLWTSVASLLVAHAATAATIEVTPPRPITSGATYERGASALRDAGGVYWLFYGRSLDFSGWYGNGNPDTSHYVIDFRRAYSLEGLAAAAAQAVGQMPTTEDKIYLGETACVEYADSIWVFAVDSGDTAQVKTWKTGDDGANWTVQDVLPAGTAPFDSVTYLWAQVFDGKIVLAACRAGRILVTSYDGAAWSACQTVVESEGLPRLFADGGTLYLYYANGATPAYSIYAYAAPDTWTLAAAIAGTPDHDADPFLTKVGADYVFMGAPGDGLRRYLTYWTAASIAGLDGLDESSAHRMTAGGYRETPWVDMWPVALDDGGDVTVFYGSEADGLERGCGRIVMLPLDWTLGNDRFGAVQNALDAAVAGDRIEVAEGAYVEDLDILTDDLELAAATGDEPVLKGIAAQPWANWPLALPNIDLQADGVSIHGFRIESPLVPDGEYSSGLVLAGTDIEIYDNAFVGYGLGAGDTGGGCAHVQSYRDSVPGYVVDVSGLDVHDNDFGGSPGGGCVGVFINHTLAGAGAVTVRDNSFSGPVVQGVVTERGETAIRDNVLSSTWGAGSRGIIVMDWDARPQSGVTTEGNSIGGFEYGIRIGAPGQTLTAVSVSGDTLRTNTVGLQVRASAGGVTVRDCEIAGNANAGVQNTDSGADLDAAGNWWGHYSGPYHATQNADGLGDAVSDDVLFSPWRGMPTVAALPADSGPINCESFRNLAFHYAPDAYTPALRGYDITFAVDAELSFGADDIHDSGALGAIGEHEFLIEDNGDGSFTVTDAILGPTEGVTVPLDFFTVDFHGAASGTGVVSILAYRLRTLINEPIDAVTAGAAIAVDCVPPGAATALAAAPRHSGVDLSWNDPAAADLDSVEIWRGLWHDGGYHSVYPEYDDSTGNTIPARPADRADALASPEWDLAGVVAAGVESFQDTIGTRGIYYYEVFPKDLAANFGPRASANMRAMNYWLADVRDAGTGDGFYDGYVNATDVTALGAAFGSEPGEAAWDNEMDVGPTSDWSGTGIPLTDDLIDFEDLMIFAMNYASVQPRPQPGGIAPRGEAPIALMEWRDQGEGVWSLVLVEPCAGLQGLRLKAALPEGTAAQVRPGALLAEQDAPAFVQNIVRFGLDASLALIGRDAAIAGSGELVRVILPAGCDPGTPAVAARGTDNGAIEADLLLTAAPALPAVFVLAQNHPNPFNPSTALRFDLPEARSVLLAIYAADGRRVAVLVDGDMPAGRHDAVWNGRDDGGEPVASGLYFARLEAGEFTQTRKLLLMK